MEGGVVIDCYFGSRARVLWSPVLAALAAVVQSRHASHA